MPTGTMQRLLRVDHLPNNEAIMANMKIAKFSQTKR